ncbi:MAG: hypothetical protein JNK07_13530 [Alphaproteobacteria bacterium]|nr:hypothetical protein [Alphaproteobacteria bacterium]
MAVELTPLAMTYYVLIGAGVVALLMAILNVGNVARAAGLICLAVAIAVVGLIVQGNDSSRMIYIAGFALLAAVALMGGYFTPKQGGGDHGAGSEHH